MLNNNGITINILTHEVQITAHILHFDIVIHQLISRYYMVKRSCETRVFCIKLTVLYSSKSNNHGKLRMENTERGL